MSFDPANIDVATAFTAFLAWTGLVGWVWSIRTIAVNARDDLESLRAERERDKIAYNARLEKAELAVASIDRLADAVKYGSERTADQIAGLTEKFSEHAALTKEKFAEIQQEQRSVRQALAAAPKTRRTN